MAAIRAAQLGASVTLIEKGALGGVCLNEGCIPTKVLHHTAEAFTAARDGALIGLRAEKVKVDWKALMGRKKAVVDTLVGGVATLMASNGIAVIKGEGTLVAPGEIGVKTEEGEKKAVQADAVIVATGSEAALPPVPGFDLEGIITSTEALSMDDLPQSMVVVGGGVIGMEFASILSALGVKVLVVEMLPEILPMMDEELTALLRSLMEGRGVTFHMAATVTSVTREGKNLVVAAHTPGGAVKLEGQKVLVATGRRPVTRGLGLDEIGVAMERGRIKTNGRMETSVRGVYAIGDCTSPIMLAHVASREGEVAAENIMGRGTEMDYKTVPSVVYTFPEMASVGMTEKDAAAKGFRVKTGRFPLMANGKAIIMNDFDGMVKYVVDGRYDEILGVHILGPRAADLIVEGALAIRLEATVEELITTVHAHPTVGEALLEGAMAVNGRALSLPKKS